MKLGPATKTDKRNKITSKKFITSMSIFQFMANLEQSGSQIPGAKFVKLIFSLRVAFYLTKSENITKKSLTQLPHYCFE